MLPTLNFAETHNDDTSGKHCCMMRECGMTWDVIDLGKPNCLQETKYSGHIHWIRHPV